ncbi:type 1 glutamine amidotransferase [Uliginosibacterium flavum]|uniref:Type 1 glutamine amidotransferase n=1 Tax=Uliginosibacterium flavum TaxID=1396831 RepID=A0ABV2TQ63_9RHOO
MTISPEEGRLRVLVLQHVPFETLGCISDWLEARNAKIEFIRFFAGDHLVAEGRYDLVIVLGGPMSANDEENHPWLREEKAYLSALCNEGRAVLGICLGAQLIANSLGADVYAAVEREIGWLPVCAVKTTPDFKFPARLDVFQWHGETFDLPIGSKCLARSLVCENQIFQFGRRVIGMQFHLEATRASVAEMLKHCSSELETDERHVQSAKLIKASPDHFYESANRVMRSVLDYLMEAS